MRGIVSLFVLLFLLLSCSEHNKNAKFSKELISKLQLKDKKFFDIYDDKSVELNLNKYLHNREIEISDIVSEVQFIPLETNGKSIIAEVNKLLCSENYYFILDSDIARNVLIFSKTGAFIKKISVGQGPKDILRPQDIALDEESKTLIVYSVKGLVFFDYEGNFIKRELVPFNFANFRVLKNGYLFVLNPNRNHHIGEVSNLQVVITDKQYRMVSCGIPINYSEFNNYDIQDYTSSFGDEVCFATKFSNKIYQYTDSISINEKFSLDFSNKQVPPKYLQKKVPELFRILEDNDYFMGYFKENSGYEYFSLLNDHLKGKTTTFIFRNKENGNIVGGNSIKLNDSLPLFNIPIASYKDQFISIIQPESILRYMSSGNIKENIKNLKIDSESNPVIITYKLKMF